MPVRVPVFFLCLAAALLPGCPRRENSAAPPPEETGKARPAVSQNAAPRQNRRQENSREERPQEVRAYTNRDDPFFGLPSSAKLPLDFTLGPLHNDEASGAPGREVFTLIRDFFAALNSGRAAEEYLHPDYRSFLARSLRNDMLPVGEWQPPEIIIPAEAAAPEESLPDEKPPEAVEAAGEPERTEAAASEESLSDEKLPEAVDAAGESEKTETPPENAEAAVAAEEPEKTPPPPGRLKAAIGSFRISEIRFSKDGLAAQTEALITNTAPPRGRTRGGLVAEKKDGRWYIAGLTIDFDGLFVSPAEKSTEVFDPGPSVGPLF